MEIAILPGNSLKIKGKQATLLVDPGEKNKTISDGTLLLGTRTSTVLFNEELGVVLQGAGEYEVKGMKITGFRVEGDVMYTVSVDGLSVFVGKVTSAIKAKDKLHEHDVVVLQSDEVLTQATLGVFNAHVTLFYGEKAVDNMKAFGKESTPAVNKYATSKDKLPTESELVLLS